MKVGIIGNRMVGATSAYSNMRDAITNCDI
jgi:hypothetical protein